MQFRIHYTTVDGGNDSFVASGDTIEEIREVAVKGVEQRNGTNPWSEEL